MAFFTSVFWLPLQELLIREFSFHQLNANLLWPGTFAFAEWLVQHRSWIEGRRSFELGRQVLALVSIPLNSQGFNGFRAVKASFSCGTGALAIFLRKSFQLDITTSDYNDQEIEENIAYNCRVNGITPILPHIKHSWGDNFPIADPDWDLIIASDILLCKHLILNINFYKYKSVLHWEKVLTCLSVLLLVDVKQYPNLIKTLSFLLKFYKPKDDSAISIMENEHKNETYEGLPRPAFLMSWRRRIGKEDESLFFTGCKNAGLEVKHMGSRVFCITPREATARTAMEELTSDAST
ncbi:hypothetical protein CK203_018780 [Vitis vinifera]|uniref:Protein N-lysine methyltransferase METTL21A n=1 Tax=Vitis vinifera TaxID=29760 RepID=A0A438JAQ2_VITVI|nr:hypothetical protein CK203_018780 [Vitis vinifera]